MVKYASDKKTVLAARTVSYQWMEANLPVHGDGKTHYYHQGPVFEQAWRQIYPDKQYDPWDPEEKVNIKSRDYGAVKGTNVKDLCDLVGGMSPGDELRIKAIDGFARWFAYENVYQPPARQGPLVLCWYNAEEGKGGERQGVGYVPNYYEGMRLVFFADTNRQGYHCFGNWDMHECLQEKYWHFYSSGGGKYPSSSGLSIKWVSEIAIYSKMPPTQKETTGGTPNAATLHPPKESSGDGPKHASKGSSSPEQRNDGQTSATATETGADRAPEQLPTVGISVDRNQVAFSGGEAVRITNIGTRELEVYLVINTEGKTLANGGLPLVYVNDKLYNPSQAIARVPPADIRLASVRLKEPYPESWAEEVRFTFWAQPVLQSN
ncbi:hypothetical protein V3F56_10165 [Moorellaceae bacterium AZ2]